ncbi:hypothetical protein [Pseudoduganella sp. OTU4001]|uniref:hypothetical protein n=1 Tax=Pseudoduganella sp. OTU4001 TaxID=3043854 RepID=UPI00313C9678
MYGLRASLLSLSLLLAACGGGGGGSSPPPPTPPAPPPPTITLSAPASQILAGGAPVVLTANVSSGATPTWQLNSGAPGKLVPGSSANTVTYEPPAAGISANTQVTVTASAGGASKQYALTVYPDPGAPGLSLIAGAIPQRGMIDGKGLTASFGAIVDVVPDQSGGYYVYDVASDAAAVRKVSAAGEVSTIYRASEAPNGITFGKLAVTTDGVVYLLHSLPSGGRLVRIKPDGSSALLPDSVHHGYDKIAAASHGAIYLVSGTSLRVLAADGTLGAAVAVPLQFVSHIVSDGRGGLLAYWSGNWMRVGADGSTAPFDLPTLPSTAVTSIISAADGNAYILQTGPQLRIHRLAPDNSLNLVYESPPDADPLWPKFALAGSDRRLLLAFTNELRHVSGEHTLNFAGMQDYIGVSEDGPAAGARFAVPDAITADVAGNVYVIDHPGKNEYPPPFWAAQRGMAIRKITPEGQVTRTALNNDTGTPSGIVADRAGNLYISDIQRFGNHGASTGSAIYKLGLDGTFSVLAGCPPSRDCRGPVADGAGPVARFAGAQLVGLDADGYLYVNDGGNPTIVRKVAPDGATTTISALPAGIGAAPDGNRYIVRDSTVVQIASDGKETVVASGLSGRPRTSPTGPLITPTGPRSFALIAGEAVLKLVLPR